MIKKEYDKKWEITEIVEGQRRVILEGRKIKPAIFECDVNGEKKSVFAINTVGECSVLICTIEEDKCYIIYDIKYDEKKLLADKKNIYEYTKPINEEGNKEIAKFVYIILTNTRKYKLSTNDMVRFFKGKEK